MGNAKVVSKKKEPRSPQQAPNKFGALVTIDEAANETVTSQMVSNNSVREDSQLAISSHMRNSRLMDFEESLPVSQQKVGAERNSKCSLQEDSPALD